MPTGIEITTLSPQEVDMVNSEWKFGTDETLPYIRWQIENFLSICIRSNGKVLGYGLQQWQGTIGMVFVKPEHRRKGISKFIALLAKKIHETDQPVFLYTDVENIASIASQKSIGYEIADCPLVCRSKYTP